MGAQAMVMAAGRGERMRPLTDSCPKPLLEVRGKPLMQYHLEALARAGFDDVLVNTAWLGEQIEARFGAALRYSREGVDFGGALETAGGVARALPQLDECFWLIGGDVFVPDFEFSRAAFDRFAAGGKLAHMILVPNRPHHPRGDFGLRADGFLQREGDPKYTYSTIGLYRKAFFASLPAGNPQGIKAPMLPLMLAAIDQGQATGELYTGPWADVGTPQRLAELNS